MQEIKPKKVDSYSPDLSEEPVVMQFFAADGSVIGRISRNKNGTEILNTERLLFADIDIGDPQLEDGCFIESEKDAIAGLEKISCASRSFFSKKKPSHLVGTLRRYFNFIPGVANLGLSPVAKIPVAVVADIAFCEDMGFRLYRTKRGLRAMCTTHEFNPRHVNALLRYMYSDPRYRRLCIKQEVFRARVSPKPWRLIIGREDEARACEYVATIGSSKILPQFESMVAYHDRVSGSFKKGLYLA